MVIAPGDRRGGQRTAVQLRRLKLRGHVHGTNYGKLWGGAQTARRLTRSVDRTDSGPTDTLELVVSQQMD